MTSTERMAIEDREAIHILEAADSPEDPPPGPDTLSEATRLLAAEIRSAEAGMAGLKVQRAALGEKIREDRRRLTRLRSAHAKIATRPPAKRS